MLTATQTYSRTQKDLAEQVNFHADACVLAYKETEAVKSTTKLNCTHEFHNGAHKPTTLTSQKEGGGIT